MVQSGAVNAREVDGLISLPWVMLPLDRCHPRDVVLHLIDVPTAQASLYPYGRKWVRSDKTVRNWVRSDKNALGVKLRIVGVRALFSISAAGISSLRDARWRLVWAKRS
jgi:hypothetical protein